MQSLSVVIITFNEAQNIVRCIRSLDGVADDILVVDSFSTDGTQELAIQAGARVVEHAFESYNAQRAFAASHARYDTVLALDADEWLSPALQNSIQNIKANWPADAYVFNRRNSIGGQYWLKHTSWYPDRKLRLFHRDKVEFSGTGAHDRIEPNPGVKVEWLPGDLMHLTNLDLSARAAQVNKLSSAAAKYAYEQGKRSSTVRLLLKPTGRFLTEYLLKRGFLDGYYGLVVAVTSAQYVWLREAKMLEMQKNTADKVQKSIS